MDGDWYATTAINQGWKNLTHMVFLGVLLGFLFIVLNSIFSSISMFKCFLQF